MSNTYQKITDYIINKIEKENLMPWHKPWLSKNLGNQKNGVTQHEYTGMNSFLTAISGFKSNEWYTFKQINNLDASIKSGEKGTPIVYFSMIKTKEVDEEGRLSTFPLAKFYYVWNREQTTLPQLETTEEKVIDFNPIRECETIIENYANKPAITHNEYRAYYRVDTDSINMPKPESFYSNAEYYATLFHELGHSTGHESRLNRKLGNSFGSHDYSKEELVAEFTSAFLCAQAKLDVDYPKLFDNSASYLKSWIKVLKDNPKWLISAASQAQKASNYILNINQTEEKIAA